MTSLAGRRVVITGAAGGLGLPMAVACIREGAHILFVGTDASRLAAAVAASGAAQGQAVAHVADLTDPAAPEAIVAAARNAFGGIDALVNNAGVSVGSLRPDFWQNPVRFWTVEEASWRRFFEINAISAIRLAAAVAPEMIRRGWGRIVNVTTSLSTMLASGVGPYGASKAALEAATAMMAGDLTGTGVTANVLTPGGPADTPMLPADAGIPRDALIPPDCLAAPLAWLLSTQSDSVTGRRYLGSKWDRSLPGWEAAAQAGAPVAWAGYGDQAKMPGAGAQRTQ
jgi:NAD(P)-dependent dehydrogenase (short-subunit alcohol dehydrogenase family)